MAMYCPFCVSQLDNSGSCSFCNYAYRYRAQPHHLPPGSILKGKYFVGRVLGEGGFGITYVGRDLTLDMKIAIKEYFPNSSAVRNAQRSATVSPCNQTAAEQFMLGKSQFIREAQTIAKMDKESSVVTVRDFFEQNGTAYIVMEFIEGRDLLFFMQRNQKPLPSEELLPLLEPIFGALGKLHKLGLIHRDISPDNIMVENGSARLIDFGCAREAISLGNAEIMLKHGFSPIEQYRNQGMGPWTDVYAMAATIYYCITGVRPPLATERILNDSLQPPSAHGVRLRPRQEKAIMKALAVDPRQRYQSMEEFAKDLIIRKNKYKIIAASACAVAVVCLAVLLIWKPGTRVETLPEARQATEIYTMADELSPEQEDMLQQVSELLSTVELKLDNNDYYTAVFENTTDYDMHIGFHVRVVNESGAITGNTSSGSSEWPRGSRLQPTFYVSCDADSKAYITATIYLEGAVLRSDAVPVSVEQPSFEFNIVNPLPAAFSSQGWNTSYVYTIDSFRVDHTHYSKQYSVTVYFGGSYDSGPDNDGGYLNYRVLDENNAVVDSGTLYIHNMYPGERFENASINIYNLPEGKYRLELSDYIY